MSNATKTFRPLLKTEIKTLRSIAYQSRKTGTSQALFNMVHMNRLQRRGLINVILVPGTYTNNLVEMTEAGSAALVAA